MSAVPSSVAPVHHAVLHACLPCLIALAVLFAALHLLVRCSGARVCFERLRDVHRCEAGGVQSLAFVLTLPLFLTIVMFIVQIALLMVGLITVNTAAFAAARSASVWIPADVVHPIDPELDEPQNLLLTTIGPTSPHTLTESEWRDPLSSQKCKKIFESAALACAPIAPSRTVGNSSTSVLGGTDADDALVRMYATLVPSSQANAVMPQRLRNKLAYSLQNTRVVLSFVDKNSGAGPSSVRGPTYNPFDHPEPDRIPYHPNEVGWQDPVTVHVYHDFALLPGPGRFLARSLSRYTGRPDDVAAMIRRDPDASKVPLTASATLTIEGLKSIRPYEQQP